MDLGLNIYSYLHSNMFLLIPNASRYAANMSLAFTFQYVSINTRNSGNLEIISFRIYIPICFY